MRLSLSCKNVTSFKISITETDCGLPQKTGPSPKQRHEYLTEAASSALAKLSLLTLSIPTGVTLGQLEDVVGDYLDSHPAERHNSAHCSYGAHSRRRNGSKRSGFSVQCNVVPADKAEMFLRTGFAHYP